MTSTNFLRGLIFVGESKDIFGGRHISWRLIYADFSKKKNSAKINLAKTNILNLDAKHIQKESTFIHLRFFFLLSNKLTFNTFLPL